MGADRLFDAEGKVRIDDSDVNRGLGRLAAKVRETVERVDGMEGTAVLKADASQLDKEIARTRAKMRSLDRERATATADMDATQFDVKEKKLQAKMAALRRERVEIDVRMGKDLSLADKALTGVVRKMRDLGRVSPRKDIEKLGDALHNARITLGPLSLSLRGMIVALTTLAPLVTALIGTIGGLTAAIGQGLFGALGLAGGAALGFGSLLGGMIGAVVAHRKEFSQFKDDVKDLGTAFRNQTRIPDSFFKAINTGLESARRLMPTFTNATNTALDTVGKRVTTFAHNLSSGGMQKAFKDLLRNSNEALGPLIGGFDALVRAAVRVGTSFSRFLPGVTKGFENWANNALRSTKNTDGLNGVVDQLMASLGEVGKLASAAGRLVINFFMAGGKSGRQMLSDITDLVNKWADWVGSKQGQKDITKFLDDSWQTTKKMATFIGNAVELIGNLASAGKPMVDMILDAANGALDFVNAIENATGAGRILITTFAGLFILKRAVGWAGALASSLLGITGGGLFGGRGGGAGGGGIIAAGGGKAGAAWGSRFKTGVQSSTRNLLTTAALAGGGAGGLRAAGGAGAKAFATGLAAGLRTWGPKLLKASGPTAALMFFLDPGNLDSEARGTQLLQAGERQSKQFVNGVSRGLNVSKDVARNMEAMFTKGGVSALKETQRQFAGISKMVQQFGAQGRRVLIRIAMSGDGEVRARLMELVQTKLGRKLLIIAERGGREGIRMLGSLAHTKLGQKLLAIIQRGGPQAQRIVDRLQSAKIRQKIVNILERGGDNVQAKLNKLLGTHLPVKKQVIQENGFADVYAKVARLARQALPDKTTTLRAEDQASSTIGGVIGLLGSIPRVVTSMINVITNHKGKARGASPGQPGGDDVAGRVAAQAAAARAFSAMGGKAIGPRMLGPAVIGEETGSSEFVIPTNPAYRGRARKLLREAIMSIGAGPRGFKRGKQPVTYQRPKKLKKVAKSNHPYLARVKNLQREIHDKDQDLTRAESHYSTDGQFRPMVDDDGQRIEDNIKWHVDTLDDLKGRSEHLATLERNLADAITTANKRLHDALNAIMQRQPKRQVKRGSGSKAHMVDNPEWNRWDRDRQNFQDALGEVPLSAATDARDSANNYDNSAYAYAGDIRAAKETKSSPLPTPSLEDYLASNGLLDSLKSLNLGVAQAAATIGDSSDDRAAAASLATFWEGVIGKIGPEGNKDLLTEAYNNLASARQGATDSGSGAPDIGTQVATFNQARDELFRSFASNFSPVGSSGGLLGAISSGVNSGVVKAMSGGGTPSSPQPMVAAGGGSSTTFQQTNNFAAPPPDPHTFVQQTKWEAQAL